MNEYVPNTWKAHNVDAGTLKSAAIAVFLVVSISVGSTIGFLSWLDAGIRSHVDPIEDSVKDLRRDVDAYRTETQELHNEVSSLRRQVEITQSRQAQRDERILERLDAIAEGTAP